MSSRQEKEKKRSASYILMMRLKSAHALRGWGWSGLTVCSSVLGGSTHAVDQGGGYTPPNGIQ